MEKLELDTTVWENSKETLVMAFNIMFPYFDNPINMVRSYIEKALEYIPEEYFDDVNKAYALCLVGEWENLSDEEYALLHNVMYYCMDLEDQILETE